MTAEAGMFGSNQMEDFMTIDKKPARLGLLATGILFTLSIMWLSASLAFTAAPQQKKHKNFKETAQLKGSPDNAGRPNGAKKAAPEPMPVPPPYRPVPMTADIGWTGLVAYSNTNGVALVNPRNHTVSPIMLNEFDYTIDPETEMPIGGQLGSEGGARFDVAMTSDGSQALISNFGDNKVFFVDLSSGTPVVSGMAKIDFFAEDIAIDPTDTWAIVADGGFQSRIAVLHIPTRTWVPAGMDPVTHDPYSWRMVVDEGDPNDPDDDIYGYANAVEIAPDGRTVILPDYFGGFLHVCLLDPLTGGLTYQQSAQLWKYGTDETAPFPFLYRPVNVAISPDGRTVMASNCVSSTSNPNDPDPDAFFEGCNIPMFTIDYPGHIVRHPDIVFPWKVAGGQSIVFSPDGKKAFYETFNAKEQYNATTIWLRAQEIQVISLTRAGQGKHTGTIHTPSWRGTSQLFGVDTMAITPDGNFLYVTNPTLSGASPIIDVIDIRTMRHVKSIGTPTHYPDPARNWPDAPLPPDPDVASDWIDWVLPEGIAFPAARANKLPVAVIAADRSVVLVDAGETVTFDGSGSHDPENSPLTYKWSLVSTPSGASPAFAPAGQTAVLTPDPGIEGTYQVGLVVNDGSLNSKMATASVIARFAPALPPSGALLQRLENDFIFFKEYVNRLAWTANPENKSTITAIKVYRKVKGASDDSYAILASLPPTATGYDDKGLTQAQLFTYRITTVNSRGQESDPAVVGN